MINTNIKLYLHSKAWILLASGNHAMSITILDNFEENVRSVPFNLSNVV